MDHNGRVDTKIARLVCEWVTIPLFTCLAVEKLAAFHFTLLANRSLASSLYAFQFSGSRGSPAHTHSMFKFRTMAFCPGKDLSLLIFYNVHCCLRPRPVTVVRVYTPHTSHPHFSEPAGQALNTLSIAFTNSGLVLLLPSTDCRPPA